MRLFAFATISLVASSVTLAQTVAPPPIQRPAAVVAVPAPAAAPAVILGPPQMNKLSQGTEVSLRLLRDLTTKGKMLKVGDRFDLDS